MQNPCTLNMKMMMKCTSQFLNSSIIIMILFSSFLLAAFFFLSKKHKERDWKSMPPELLEEISDRLPIRDLVAFRGVCAAWRRAPSGRAAIPRFPRTQQMPWLMFYGFDTHDMCYAYCHSQPECCRFRLPHLRGATVLQSRSGWLLARRDEKFFLANPFTLAKIDLPKHRVLADQAGTMTTLPTARQSKVFIVSRKDKQTLEINFCRVGDTEWKSDTIAVGTAQLGNILRVNACNCSDGHDAESCGFKDADCIYIRGSKVTVAYKYSERMYIDEGENPSSGGNSNLQCWYEGPESQLHRTNWLRRFGEKGISISICYQSIRLARKTVGFLPMTEVVPGNGTATEHTSVKATWIEPIFT